jgi:membrane-associated phospholipid phosphatase
MKGESHMDLQYLLFLQHFRDGIGAPLAPFMIWISDFIISSWTLAAIALIYWVWDRRGGRRILLGFCYGAVFNALLKLTFCVYRPWIRDSRIVPYGNAISSAGGYSFPSGHSTQAATVLGGISFLMKQKKLLLPACLLFSIGFIVMFSRNYLGVHTPQDVIVGFLLGLFSIFAAEKTENWTDKDGRRDWIFIATVALLCVTLALYYEYKTYPADYLPNGTLLYDPKPETAYQYQGFGGLMGYAVARFFERRGFDFEKLDRTSRLAIGLLALIPLHAISVYIGPVLVPLVGHYAANFLKFFFFAIYILNLVPQFMYFIYRKR